MDEYLFIVLAKLKADRLKVQREQRLAGASQEEPSQRELFAAPSTGTTRHSRKARWFSSEPDWPVRT